MSKLRRIYIVKKWLFWGLGLLLLLSGCSNFLASSEESEPKLSSDTLKGAQFDFFDVGQGDSTLIRSDDGTTILIDTGRQDDDRIMTLLQEKEIKKIDLLLLTHPHADHIGNADKIIKTYQPKEIWMDGLAFNSSTYEKVVDAALASDAHYKEPRTFDKANFGPFSLEVLSPSKLSGNANDDSIAVRLTYKEISAIFTGDAEKGREKEMIESGLPLQADILDLGHHGSSTSNSPAFLDKVKPEVAIYSAEKGNSYGHPHVEVLEWLKERNITTYGTDVNGTVTLTTDGEKLNVVTEKEGKIKSGSSYSISKKTEEASKTEDSGNEEMPDSINLNTASAKELEFLPLIGPELAQKIIASRPYSSIDDLKRINGIGKGIVRQIKEQGLATTK
ncbi:MBL fold metallo-hydrolase [Listeria aquatica]|uniref:MBL fold metallo-hydrolase n=1 Tax=Listeria aquatica TaxID=1494960 RepID=A0A841ZJS7_9LIST|nr:MBL fold metallo-hydrolase [Listeria aquatica]MBC1520333.1 MBL fold metallo-hydrolase [Listeria aquatica]